MSHPSKNRQQIILNQIRLANTVLYNEPNEVDTYLLSPYHSLRAHLAIQMLRKEISINFENVSPGEIRVLELASSSGKIASLIEKFGYQVIASDVEFTCLSVARRLNLTCVQFDAALQFPFQSGSVNAIFMGELVEHLFNTDLLISECNRVLCNKGVLVITTPNLAKLQDRLKFMFGYAPRQVNPIHKYLKLHIRPFTYSLLNDVLREKGFRVDRLCSNYVVFDLSSGKQIKSRFLARLFPQLGGTLIVSAHKVV